MKATAKRNTSAGTGPTPSNLKFGQRIQKARNALGWTVIAAAIAAKINIYRWSAIERGIKATLEEMEAVAGAVGLEFVWSLRESEDA